MNSGKVHSHTHVCINTDVPVYQSLVLEYNIVLLFGIHVPCKQLSDQIERVRNRTMRIILAKPSGMHLQSLRSGLHMIEGNYAEVAIATYTMDNRAKERDWKRTA